MRTTLSIDQDVLLAAKSMAAREQKTVGEVLSQLARQGLQRGTSTRQTRNGVPLLRRNTNAAPVTLEFVNQLRDEVA